MENTLDYKAEFTQLVDSLMSTKSATSAAPKAVTPATSVATKAVDVAKEMVSQTAVGSSKPVTSQAKPTSSVATKATNVAKSMVTQSADSSKKPATNVKPATTERKEVRSVTTTSRKTSATRTNVPKKIVSSAQEKTSVVEKKVRHFAREKKGALRSGLDSMEGRIYDFFEKLDNKVNGK